MSPKFYLILKAIELTDELADALYEAGFDDSNLVMRNAGAAIWITNREGEFTMLAREALAQARQGGLTVRHVEIDAKEFS
jgi:hypothetical protein